MWAQGQARKFVAVGHVEIKNIEFLVIPDRWGRNGDMARKLLYMPKRYSRNTWDFDIASQGDNRGAFMDDKSGKQFVVFSNAKKDVPDMVLGMDVLRYLHIYLALKEKR